LSTLAIPKERQHAEAQIYHEKELGETPPEATNVRPEVLQEISIVPEEDVGVMNLIIVFLLLVVRGHFDFFRRFGRQHLQLLSIHVVNVLLFDRYVDRDFVLVIRVGLDDTKILVHLRDVRDSSTPAIRHVRSLHSEALLHLYASGPTLSEPLVPHD
jgi:hypothetical protein